MPRPPASQGNSWPLHSTSNRSTTSATGLTMTTSHLSCNPGSFVEMTCLSREVSRRMSGMRPWPQGTAAVTRQRTRSRYQTPRLISSNDLSAQTRRLRGQEKWCHAAAVKISPADAEFGAVESANRGALQVRVQVIHDAAAKLLHRVGLGRQPVRPVIHPWHGDELARNPTFPEPLRVGDVLWVHNV